VLNADDAWSLRYQPRGRVLRFSMQGVVEGAYLAGEHLMLLGEPLVEASEIPLRGRHNVANVLAAMATAHAAGVEREPMLRAIRAFQGVAHRLQTVGYRRGVQYVDDSIATAPERSIAAISSYDEPLVLIAGGRDKHLPMEDWATLIARRVRHVVLLGEMGDLVAAAIRAVEPNYSAISRAGSMDEAVAQAASVASSGDVVLLSPGGTSYDMYLDFEERGRDFSRAVSELPA
jgi:UDP-N-acetylmuramoylalanine--D-glutamate ligase